MIYTHRSFAFVIVFILMQRIRIEGIRKHPWFRKNYNPVKCSEEEEVNLDDVRAVFDDIEVGCFLMLFLVVSLIHIDFL